MVYGRFPHWFAVLVGATQAACLTCSEVEETERASAVVQEGKTAMAANGAFLFEGRRYASCTEFCRESGVFLDLEACTAPTVDAGVLELSCTGTRASCKDALSFGSGRYTTGIEQPPDVVDLASYFACMSHGERAAVASFARLARELARFGAPAELVLACGDAEADERRHARMFQRLHVATLGKRGPSPSLAPMENEHTRDERPLEHMLAENVVEGCLGETVGAWVLAIQASRAEHPAARAAFRAIARDEASHADTSLRIARAFPHAMRSAPVREALADALDPRRLASDPFRRLGGRERAVIGAPAPAEVATIVGRVQRWLRGELAPAAWMAA